MKKPIIIYHANCADGFCAAWVAKNALGRVALHPAHYGTTPPDVTNRDVHIVDFCYPLDVMRDIVSKANRVVLLDHHKTNAQIALELTHDGTVDGMFDLEHSGARLAWDFYRPDHPNRPWLVDYVEDRDLWRHALPDTKAVNAALRSYPQDMGVWDGLHVNVHPDQEESWIRFVSSGEAILRAEEQVIDAHVRNANLIEIAGYTVPCVNATTQFSEIAGRLAAGKPFAACYFDRVDGQRQWSLRSVEGEPQSVDVSEIAKQFGGGGHKHAAGFQTMLTGPRIPFREE